VSVANDPKAIVETLRSVHDPCCRERGISIVDMGLVRSIDTDGSRARIELVLTSGWCPFASHVLASVRREGRGPARDRSGHRRVTWDEAWTTERMSADARAKLRFLPEPSEVSDRARYIAAHSNRSPGARVRGEDTTDDR
jgi:metal-sulfur cluster biosynthetic enzyme